MSTQALTKNLSDNINVQIKCNIYEAVNSDNESVALNAAVGRVAASKVCFYPPGVPIINPGEVISSEIKDKIFSGLNAGLEVIGLQVNTADNEITIIDSNGI